MYGLVEMPHNYFVKSHMRLIIFNKYLNYNLEEKKCHKAQEHMEAK